MMIFFRICIVSLLFLFLPSINCMDRKKTVPAQVLKCLAARQSQYNSSSRASLPLVITAQDRRKCQDEFKPMAAELPKENLHSSASTENN